MSTRHLPAWTTAEGLEPLRSVKRQSFARLAISDALIAFGTITALSAIAGMGDDRRDSLILLAFAGAAVTIGSLGHKALVRAPRPPTAKILTGLVVTWATLVAMGTGIYLATGTINNVGGALVESAAGFSTTAVTMIDPSMLSTGMQLWRASTQWFGGLLGLLIGIIALPQALRSSSLIGQAITTDQSRMVTRPIIGTRRIAAVYSGFTALMVLAYAGSGLSNLDSVVYALTTVSTGGFSSHADSFAGFGGAPRIVATAGMIIAGSSFFVIWWAIRGQVRPLLRSSELRIYAVVIVISTVLLSLPGRAMSVGDSLFITASAVSTTGYAVGDWTKMPDFSLTVLLVVVTMGSMAGSAGGGLRVLRVHALLKSVLRDLRLQLDPHRVVVIKNSGRPVEESSIDRISGYQVAHIFVAATGAFIISISGIGVVDSLWMSLGTLSTFGPAPGIGPFGYIGDVSAWVRLALVPMMLAARLSVLVVLLGFVWVGGLKKSALAEMRRRVTAAGR